jgi:hypothetical protein
MNGNGAVITPLYRPDSCSLKKSNCDGALTCAWRCSGRVDREKRPFPHNRSDFDPVAKHLEPTADDRKPAAQTVAAFGRKAREGLEDSQQLIFRNADARVVYIDLDFGPFPSRRDDGIGFTIGATHVDGRIAPSETLQNLAGLSPVPVRNSEYVVEAYYTCRPRNGLEVRPQYLIQPGGTRQNRNALVFGLKR